ncbi:N-acetylmuramoyl-L-alanine amidase [Paenibacillus sp. GCM10027627]|uniref:N-acetylmuramoyl-L-alanine amidase family protein n=1 Tax=unclassified Paenibacillus TaxID=185978 RepID=UPI00363AD40C
MHLQREKKQMTKVVLIPLLLIIIAGSLFMMANQSPKQSGETTKALSGKKEQSGTDNEETVKPVENSNGTYKIMIDPGHGGKDPGAPGVSGTEEKVSNLAIALKVGELLGKDSRFEVRLTRTDDTFVEIEERSAMANAWDADALISIHGNTYEDGSVEGTETFYRYDSGMALAAAIQQKVVSATGFRDRGAKLNELKVLTLSTVPAVLLETGYLTNATQEAFILSEAGQGRIAEAIVDGLKQYIEELDKESGGLSS